MSQPSSSDIELAEVSDTLKGASFFHNAHSFAIENQVNINAENSQVKVDVHHHHIEGNGTCLPREYASNSDAGRADSLIARLNPIPDASYSRDRTRSPPNSRCLPGTRTKVLNEITSWIESGIILKEDPSHVLWLHGYVGCGKSAIAQVIAETFAKKKRLAASYFFFRGSTERSKSERFAQTLAKDLAVSVPSTKPIIARVVEEEGSKALSMSDLAHQVQSLFFDPYESALSNPARRARQLVKGPFLTVIDGLDECEDRAQVAGLVERIVGFFKDNPRSPLRFLISSRVEQHIHAHLSDPHARVRSMDLPAHTSDEDIESVIDETFKDAAKRDWVIRAYGPWPGPGDRYRLVVRADKSLVAISTLLRFILIDPKDGSTAKDRLTRALDLHIGLDGLYAELLAGAESRPHFRDIVTTIALLSAPLSIEDLTEVLRLEPGDVINVIGSMCSIFHVPGDDRTPVTPCHSSLLEFLTTEARSLRFYASPSHHKLLAHRFFELMHHINGIRKPTYSNRVSWHWPAFVKLHRDNHCRLQQELEDLVVLFLTIDDASRAYPSHSIISAYSIFDSRWVTRIRAKMPCPVPEFFPAFLGIREMTESYYRATDILAAIDAVVCILHPDGEARDNLAAILESASVRSASIYPSPNPCMTLLTKCISYLFVHRPRDNLPIVFLPFCPPSHNMGSVPDLAGYSLWAFSQHLAQVLEHNPECATEQVKIVEEKGQGKADGALSGRECSDFILDFISKQWYPGPKEFFGKARYIEMFKTNLAKANTVVAQLLGVGDFQCACYDAFQSLSAEKIVSLDLIK